MDFRLADRLSHILDAIVQIERLAAEGSLRAQQSDIVSMAAFERFLEIISEASRHIPDQLKESAPEIPWRQIADIGNVLRHAYASINREILFNVYESGQLAKLKDAIVTWSKSIEQE